MALTQVKSDAIADDAVTVDKLANAINTERAANTAKSGLADNSVTLAKMAGGADGQIITYDASGDPVAVGPGTDGQVLTSTGAGSPPAFEDLPTSGAALTGSTNNTVVTVTGANAMQGEANLHFDGTRLLVGSDTSTRDEAKVQVFGNADTNYIAMENISASDSDGARYGKLIYRGTQSGGEKTDLVHLIAAHDGSADDQKGKFLIKINDGDDNNSPTERFRITSSGTVGIGETTPLATCHVKSSDSGTSALVAWGDDFCVEGSGDSGLTILSGTSSDGSVIFGDSGDADVGRIAYNHASNYMSFDTNGGNRLRITSDGKVSGGSGLPASPSDAVHFRSSSGSIYARFTTHDAGNDKSFKFGVNGSGDGIIGGLNDTSLYLSTNNTSRMKVMNDGTLIRLHTVDAFHNTSSMELKKAHTEGTPAIRWCRPGAYSGWGTACEFIHNSTTVGTVKYSTGSTQYNTSSDYRLKENITGLTGAITRVKQLTPKRFNFKIDSSVTVDGFLAHEVDSIVPEAVDGTKDEVITQAGKDSGKYAADATVGDPVYQGIDQSKLVPLLTAALKEAITKIETLETKVAALEAG